MILPRDPGLPLGPQELYQQGPPLFGSPPQQPQQGFAQPFQQVQQGMPVFAQPLPLSGGASLGNLQQFQQGYFQPAQQFRQGMSPSGAMPPLPQQGFFQPFVQTQQAMPGYLQPLPQQGVGQAGYPQSLQGMVPPGFLQQPQPGFPGHGEQIQQGMAQPGYPQSLQFAGQGAPFPGGFDISRQAGRGQPDVPRSRIGPKNYARTDERIRELICERLIKDLSIDVSEVGVEVQSARVSLSGTVPDRQMKHAIEDVVDNCWGVQDIENNIHVQSGQESGIAGAMASGQHGRPIAQAGGGFASSTAATTGGKSAEKSAESTKGGRSKEE